MNKAPEEIDTAKQARALLNKQSHGILSTHSLDMPGYPFGSLTPYCLDENAEPIILISTIAQHTKNIIENPKVSLTVLEEPESEEIQALGRVTYIAKAIKVEEQERYYRYFPLSKSYSSAHGFNFYKLDTVRIRYIGGFGNICWIEASDHILKNPFNSENEKYICDHMNNDHKDSLVQYLAKCKNLGAKDSDEIIMCGIDSEGFDILTNNIKHRFNFHKSISGPDEAREEMINLLK